MLRGDSCYLHHYYFHSFSPVLCDALLRKIFCLADAIKEQPKSCSKYLQVSTMNHTITLAFVAKLLSGSGASTLNFPIP